MISLIIPAYHPNKELEQMTERCIESLGDIDYEALIMIDEKGAGYAKTVNRGLEESEGNPIIIGNNDLVFHDNWLTELMFPLNIGYDIATCWTSDQDVKPEDRIESGAKFGSLFAMNRYVYDTLGPLDEQFKGYFRDRKSVV